MSNKFLGATSSSNLADGTVLIYASSLGASGLNPSYPVKTNSLRQLVSSKLNISDINNLQDTLDNVLTNPFAYVGSTGVTNKIYKSFSSDGLSATISSLTDNGSVLVSSATNGISANKFAIIGGTGIQYLMGDGTTLTQSANSGNSNFYLYKNVNSSQTTPPPISQEVIFNNSTQSLATKVYINHITRDNIDIEVFFKQVSQLNDLYIQDQNNSLNYIRYNITGAPIPSNTYISIPVVMTSFGGTGGDTFGNYVNIMVAFFTNLSDVDTRLSAVETKTQNQSAGAYATSFTGQTNFKSPTPYNQNLIIDSGSLVNSISSYAYNETQLCALEITSSGTEFNGGAVSVNNSITASSFIKSGGLSTQFLKANGSVDTNTYLTSVITTGYPFNPVSRATGTITSSTKSYYFTCLINQATLISGLSIYIDNGSDNFRMGIYRGCINTLTSASMTLCGQTAGGVLPISATTVFHRLPFSLVSGQSLTFANGDYMTIAFHSAGSTNLFLTGQSTTAFWTDLGYNTTQNYAIAGFPASLSPSSILGGIPQRPCFELY